ncbi:hypothetical protein [Bdellovibrio bacteriovorus]|uniref:hypothetical protein n=1 Tax=Bdellovibrio bacteriovorus TaxID=959 RepID=UPI0035A99043
MKVKNAFGVLLGSIFVALFYQNCSGGFSSINADQAFGSSTLIVGEGNADSSSNDPVSGQFKAGDPFNLNQVPSQSQMIQVLLQKTDYLKSPHSKAVAIAGSGLGYVSVLAGATQTAAEITALEGCFALSGGSPCALLAKGNVFAVNQSDLNSAFTFEIPVPSSLSANAIPFVPPSDRSSILTSYLNAPSPKALAVSVDGAYYWISNQVNYPLGSDAEAKRLALERCELIAAMPPCTLYAVNANPVFKGQEMNLSPAIDYSRKVIGLNIPAMRELDFSNYINAYLNFLDSSTSAKGAIYVSATGAWGAAYSTSAATNVDTKALSDCNNSGANTALFPCVKYATNKGVVANPKLFLKAWTAYSPEIHCQVVPRRDCAAHKAMGCPVPGDYYTQQSGSSIQLERCL